jgi:hypothetical protein
MKNIVDFVFIALAASFMLLPGYSGAQCNNTTVLTLTGPGTSTWTSPSSGTVQVRITASGASGGAYLEANPDRTGGTGATMSGTFIIGPGTTLRAIAGGGGFHSQLEGGGGGGASGVVNCGNPSVCANGAILIIAAGGNGGQLNGPNGGFGLGGSDAANGDGEGGSIQDNDSGGGGGAQNSDGESAGSGGGGGLKVSLTGLSAGGNGSSNMNSTPPSGFNHGGAGMGGGGGGGDGATFDTAAGGGGGHTGGDAGNAAAASSFNSGTSQDNTPGTNGAGSSGPKSTPSNPGTVTIVCLQVLPVALSAFSAVIDGQGEVRLRWSTASEKDNRGFDVEHSLDNSHWQSLGFVPGNGTTAETHQYLFTDKTPVPGVNYYRLRQTDFDGDQEFSPIVVADVHIESPVMDVFPNPSVSGALSVRVLSRQEGEALLEVFDWAGFRVVKQGFALYEGTNVWPLSMETFPKGAYTARLEMPDGSLQFKKIVLQ